MMTDPTPQDALAESENAAPAVTPRRWRYLACMLANAVFIAIPWCIHNLTSVTSNVHFVAREVTTGALIACLALASLFTMASRSASKLSCGAPFLGATIIAIAVSPMFGPPYEIEWGFVELFVLSCLVAAIMLRLLGLSVDDAQMPTLATPKPWQFSLRSMIGGTVIVAGYALALSEGGMLNFLGIIFNSMMPPGSWINGFAIIRIVLVSTAAVVATSLGLRGLKYVAIITLIGLFLILQGTFGLPLDRYLRGPASSLKFVLISIPGIVVPWMLAGIHTTWKKPVFER
jgi:hypothetical protein